MNYTLYTSYKETFELYTEIHCLTSFNSFHIEPARKEINLLSNAAMILSDVEKRYMKLTISVDDHSIGDFNARVKVPALEKRQD